MQRFLIDITHSIKIIPDPKGAWCKYSDVAALESQLQAAQEQGDEWRVQRDFFLTRLEEEKERMRGLLSENAALRDNLEALKKEKQVLFEDQKERITEGNHLRIENAALRANSLIQEHIINSNRNPEDKEKIIKLTMENAALRADNAGLINVCKIIHENEEEWGQCRYCHAESYPVDEHGNKLEAEDTENAQEYWTDHEDWCPSAIIDNNISSFENPGDSLLQDYKRLQTIIDINGICLTCGGVGEITVESGQMPEHYECRNAVCEDCNGTGGKQYARLLKELEVLRAVQDASQAIISYIDIECDGECQDLEYMKLEQGLRNTLAAAKGESNQTTWRENGEFWECEKCGYAFALTGGTPAEHEISYCPKCGRQIAEFVTKGAD